MIIELEIVKMFSQIDRMEILLLTLLITLILGIGTILLNQRKIRKELRLLREMMENKDKPNGETYESDTE